MMVGFQTSQHTCVHAYSLFTQTPFVSAGYLQMNMLRCCDALPQLLYHFHFGQIFIAAIPLIVCQWWRAAVLECVWLWHMCANVTKIKERQKKNNKKLIIFWWEQIYFKQVWNLHTVTANEVSCKIAVIIGILSSGTQLACAHACVCARVWRYGHPVYVNALVGLVHWACFA